MWMTVEGDEAVGLWKIEEQYWTEGYSPICGADEAGAGPLAGPVYAAAVILPKYAEFQWLNDSKQVTPKRREALFGEIKEQAIAWSVASVDAQEIDATDILSARMRAMQLAIDGLAVPAGFALIDGNRDKGKTAAITTCHVCVVKGDGLSASIAAASILAKVSRDRFMEEMADKYPEYRFDKHKGYGTKLHYATLDRYGPSPIHRLTFLKKWEAKR